MSEADHGRACPDLSVSAARVRFYSVPRPSARGVCAGRPCRAFASGRVSPAARYARRALPSRRTRVRATLSPSCRPGRGDVRLVCARAVSIVRKRQPTYTPRRGSHTLPPSLACHQPRDREPALSSAETPPAAETPRAILPPRAPATVRASVLLACDPHSPPRCSAHSLARRPPPPSPISTAHHPQTPVPPQPHPYFSGVHAHLRRHCSITHNRPQPAVQISQGHSAR